eukprot:scaffold498_cov291-Prasinococcus_capsulatus_cf.AAC.3
MPRRGPLLPAGRADQAGGAQGGQPAVRRARGDARVRVLSAARIPPCGGLARVGPPAVARHSRARGLALSL